MDGPVCQENSVEVVVANGRSQFHTLILELCGYGLASAVALAVDVTVLKVLVAKAGWHYLAASTVSFLSGTGVSYVFSVRLAFSSHRIKRPSLEFACFAMLGFVGLAVNAAAMWVSIGVVSMGLVPAKLTSAVCTFATNFVLRRLLLFSPSSPSRRNADNRVGTL